MARARTVTEKVREMMYDIACLEPEELSRLREALRAWRLAEGDDARRHEIETTVDRILGTRDAHRAANAFEALTETRP